MNVYSVTPEDQHAISGLYVAFWNRAPDKTGFGFWVNKLSSGEATLNEIATEFRELPEGIAEYPQWSTNAELVNNVYVNVFGRAPDTQGFAFWLNKLDSGALSFPELVVAMCEAALTNGSADGALYLNKVDVGIYTATVAQVEGGYVCDNAFNLVTSDPASIVAAESWIDSNNFGETYTLTTNIDTINVAGQSTNTVTGVQQTTNATWNTGDTINGNGSTRINLIANGNGGGVGIVDANNIATLNINLVQNTTLDEVEFNEVDQIVITQGVVISEGGGLTAINANQSTVHGFAKTGMAFRQTVNYADTSGTTDVAALMVAGTGSATSNSTFNVANDNTIEAVTLATSGTNYVTLNGGTAAAKFTLSGSGTNAIAIGSAAESVLIDATRSSGLNTLDLGSQLSTGDTVIGGSGRDELIFDLNRATQILPTISGVETLSMNFSAAGILNASKIVGATTLNIAGSTQDARVTNLASSANLLNTTDSNTGIVNVYYAVGAAANVTYSFGGSDAVSNAATSFSNIASLAILGSGKSTSATGDLALGSTAKNLTISTEAAANDLTIGNLIGTGLQTINVNANAGDVVLGSINDALDGSKLSALDVVASNGADVTIGNINANSGDASGFSSLSVLAGDDSTISIGGISGLTGKNTVSTYSVILGNNIGNSSIGAITAKAIGDINVSVGSNANGAGRNLDLSLLTAGTIGDVNIIVGKNNTVAISTLGSGLERHLIGNITAAGNGNFNFLANFSYSSDSIGTVDLTGLSGSSNIDVDSFEIGTVMLGGAGADYFRATDAADVIMGNDANDTLLGEDGDDEIDGDDGADSINGGTGNDVIHGDAGNDTLKGSYGDDVIYGDDGDDYILAGSDNDNVWCGDGNDWVSGGSGSDLIYGDAGNDTINGNAGDDILTGGSGADTFFYDPGSSDLSVATAAQVLAANGTDTITDFTTAQGDKLFVSSLLQPSGGYYADRAFVSGTSTSIAAAPGFNNVIVVTNVQTGADGSMTLAEVDTLIATLSIWTGSGTLLVNNNGIVQLYYDSNLANAGGASDVALIGVITTTGIAADLVNITVANFPEPAG